MAAANPERGEVEVELGGKVYPLRPSWQAMRAIEAQTRSLLRLYLDWETQALTAFEAAVIITECIKAAGVDQGDPMLRGVKLDKIAELIYEAGLIQVLGPVQAVVWNMLEGGATGKKKAEEKRSKA